MRVSRGSAPPLAEAGSVLVVGPTWVGDTVFATPFLASLRSALPRARVSFLASGWTRPLAECFPWVDRVFVLGEGGGGRRGRWRRLPRLLGELREEALDFAFLLPNSFRSALVAFLAGAKRRVGYAGRWRGALLTDAVATPDGPSPPHQVDHYLGLLEALGVEPLSRTPWVPVTEEARDFARRLWEEMGLPEEGVVGFHPGAFFGASKLWPPERYAALARLLQGELGLRVVVLGGPAERELGEAICREAGEAVNLAGRDDLGTLPGVLARLSLLVGGDTGPLHLAAAVGTPTVSLFGPTDPRRTRPRGGSADRHAVIALPLPCAPCFARRCPLGHHACMREVSAGDVFERAKELLSAVSHRGGRP